MSRVVPLVIVVACSVVVVGFAIREACCRAPSGARTEPVEPIDPPGDPGAEITVRVALTLPHGTPWHRALLGWKRDVSARSAGRIDLHVEPTDAVQDDLVVSRLLSGAIDGAHLGPSGLIRLLPALDALQAPGGCDTYEAIDRVRALVDPEIRAALRERGLVLVGWGDFGLARIFSAAPLTQTAELAGADVIAFRASDSIAATFGQLRADLQIIRDDIPTLMSARPADVVLGTSLDVGSLRWTRHLRFVSDPPLGVMLGATVISAARVDALPPSLREILLATGEEAHAWLQRDTRSRDASLDSGNTALDVATVPLTDVGTIRAAGRSAMAERGRRDALFSRITSLCIGE